MSGYQLQTTGKIKRPNILIHNWEGARADFLGSILLDRFRESRDGRVSLPGAAPKFIKIHDNQDIAIPEKTQTRVIIRVDHNWNLSNIMQIIHNQFRKDNPDPNNPPLEDRLDHFYLRTKWWIDAQNNRQINRTHYDYWIDFSALEDLNFLKELYAIIRGTNIPNELLSLMQINLDNQTKWSDDHELIKLSALIDFELKFNLFHWFKKFTLSDYMATSDYVAYLKLQNYSLDEPI